MSQKKLSAFFKPLQNTALKEKAKNIANSPKRKSNFDDGPDVESEHKAKQSRTEIETGEGIIEGPPWDGYVQQGLSGASKDSLSSSLSCKSEITDENAPLTADENATAKSFQPTLNFKSSYDDVKEEIRDMASRLPVMDPNMGPSWYRALKPEFKKPYFQKLNQFVMEERMRAQIYPPPEKVWSWTKECSLDFIKVVILGQDPYHNPNQAHGLCFSVQIPVPPPPSLVNMYKELATDIEGFTPPKHGYLIGWARQGVLLLNACLTVRKNMPNSHKDQGWENLTTSVIKHLNEKKSGIVFLLWGAYAQKKADFVDKKKHCVLKTVHPSPLSASRGWFGSKHFSKCNAYLESVGKKPINWAHLPEK